MRGWSGLVQLAERQHTVVAVSQLPWVGASVRSVQRAAADGRLERVRPRVYGLPGANSPHRAAMSALLAVGTTPTTRIPRDWPLPVLGLRSAAAVYGMVDRPPAVVELIAAWAHPEVRLAGVRVIRSRTLEVVECCRHGPLALTAPQRTFVDLCRLGDQELVVEAGALAMQLHLASLTSLERAVAGAARAPGAPLARDALALLRRLGKTDSAFERAVRRYISARGVHPHPGTYPVRIGGRVAATVDLAFPAWKVYAEADGFGWHSLPDSLSRDHVRQNDLSAGLWLPVRVTRSEFAARPERFLSQLVATLRARGWPDRVEVR